MAECKRKTRRRLGGVVVVILLFAGVAFSGLLFALWAGSSRPSSNEPLQGSALMCLVAVAVLSLLLAGLAWTGSSVVARAVVAGLLGGLAITINAALGLAVMDYAATGDMAVALRMLPVPSLLAPVGAVIGLPCGYLVGVIASFAQRRASRGDVTEDQGTPSATGHRSHRMALLAGCGLLVLVGLLAVPAYHEATRRYAVLALRAHGAYVEIDQRSTTGWRSWLKRWEVDWPDELPIYSLESVSRVSLRTATDADFALVGRLTEISELDASGSDVTDCGLAHLAALGSLSSVSLRDTAITDDGLSHLAALSGLQSLYLDGAAVGDAGLRHVAGLASLQDLSMRRTQITDEGLRHLAGLTSLRCLYISETQVTDVGLRHLAGLTSLRYLDLSETQVHGSGLSYLPSLSGLQSVCLRRAHLTLPGLQELGKLPLFHLDLTGAQFGATTFAELSHLGTVRVIYLDETNMTDASLPFLANMKSCPPLITLRGTQVTERGVSALQRSLPSTKIITTRETK